MRYLLILFVMVLHLAAVENSKLYDCTKVFEDRKNELLLQLDQIDEQQQSLSALKIATDNLLKKKTALLKIQEQDVNDKLKLVTQKEKAIKKMLDENKKILASMKKATKDKISQTYSKMKPAAAAGVLSDMNESVAAGILRDLNPKVIGKILTQMSPQKASRLTVMLTHIDISH
jgi:flagellar motility protein MotE (MotC chaperone)